MAKNSCLVRKRPLMRPHSDTDISTRRKNSKNTVLWGSQGWCVCAVCVCACTCMRMCAPPNPRGRARRVAAVNKSCKVLPSDGTVDSMAKVCTGGRGMQRPRGKHDRRRRRRCKRLRREAGGGGGGGSPIQVMLPLTSSAFRLQSNQFGQSVKAGATKAWSTQVGLTRTCMPATPPSITTHDNQLNPNNEYTHTFPRTCVSFILFKRILR